METKELEKFYLKDEKMSENFAAMAKRIKESREKVHLTQENLAEVLDVSRIAVAKWENGTSLPSLVHLVKMVKIFNTTSDYILGINNANSLCITDKALDAMKILIKEIT